MRVDMDITKETGNSGSLVARLKAYMETVEKQKEQKKPNHENDED